MAAEPLTEDDRAKAAMRLAISADEAHALMFVINRAITFTQDDADVLAISAVAAEIDGSHIGASSLRKIRDRIAALIAQRDTGPSAYWVTAIAKIKYIRDHAP